MNMHKRIRLTSLDRQKIWRLHGTGNWTIAALAREFRVSRPTIYKVIHRARHQEFAPRKSTNKRFLNAKYGMKRLAKVEVSIERKKKVEAKRYNKDYPGEMIHFDTKRLPLLKGETRNGPEYISNLLGKWVRKHNIVLQFIQPGKPQQNAYVERYNRTVRYDWLSQYVFKTIEAVQIVATRWLWTYNNEKLNMGIGGITPMQKLAMVAT